MNEIAALLVVERGPVPTTQVPLQSEQLTVGRSAGNDLVLADPEVSRRHMRVVRRTDGFAVEDIGSTNGTFVNGQRISHLTLLQDGDAIDLGDTVRLRFVSTAQPPPTSEPDLANNPTQAFSPTIQPAELQGVVRPAHEPVYPPPPAYTTDSPRRGRGLLIGCGLLLALLLVCAGTFLVLDAYDQGRLLYCGPLASFFEIFLGPFGFAPVCP